MRRREGGCGSRCVGGGVGGGNGLECEVEGGVERAEGSGEKRVGGGAKEEVPKPLLYTISFCVHKRWRGDVTNRNGIFGMFVGNVDV